MLKRLVVVDYSERSVALKQVIVLFDRREQRERLFARHVPIELCVAELAGANRKEFVLML